MLKRIFFLTLLSLLPTAALAAAPTYDLISPIGGMTTGVDLKTYLQKIIITTIGIAGVLAVVMLVICGIKVMMSGSSSGKSEAKECVWNAIFGLLIAIAAWAILFTINPDLLKNDLQLAGIPVSAPLAPGTPTVAPNPTTPGCYFKYKRLDTQNINFTRADTCPSCNDLLIDVQTNPQYEILSKCYEVKAGVPTAPPGAGAPPPPTTGVQCPRSGQNLCEPKFRTCTNAQCARFSGLAAGGARGVATAALIKAIIMEESSCGNMLVGDGGASCGPMQVSLVNANKFKDRCGLSQPVTCSYLANQANWDKAICLGAEYLNSLTSLCGNDVRNLAAGYNGGGGVCKSSVNCSADKNCAGTTVQIWECLYADNAHTQCDPGYSSTRNYATEVLYCTQNPGY